MKIRFYLALAAAALVMTNCSKDEEMQQTVNAPKSFTATIEGASRSAVDETTGGFSWTYGDKISVWNGTSFDVYANSEADVNTFVAEGNAGDATGYAIYPSGGHNISDNTVTVNLPATYSYGSTNAPMLAEVSGSSLAFKHLAGVMRFQVNSVPVGASSFVFTMTDTPVTGDYTVTDGQINASTATVSSDNTVTITFDALATAQNMTFYVPLPVGTYGAYKVEIKGENIDLSHESTSVTNTIGRRTLLLMPVYTCESNSLKKGEGNTIDVTAQDTSVSGNQSLTINVPDNTEATATLVLNYTPQEGNATLSLSDNSTETEPQTSVATVKVQPADNNVAVETLNINTPTLTVELGAGQYGTVEALTATETLVIGEGVTIETLVLNGGSLQVNEAATIGEIVVKDEAGLKTAIAAGGKVVLGADVDLAAGLWIGSDCEIDLNGYYIKRTTGGAIYVKTGKSLTIGGKDGSLVESTHDGGAAIWNMAGTLIINGGTYKSSGSQIATIYCDRINDDAVTRKGTWNLTINSGTFISESFTAVSLQNNRTDSDHSDYEDGLIEINGGIFTGGGGLYDLYLANVIVNIDTEDCTFTNGKVWNNGRNKINGEENEDAPGLLTM